MINARTLADLLGNSLECPRGSTFLEGNGASDTVSGKALNERAARILYRLRSLGAARGDHLILLTNSNVRFVEGFWAAVLGGIVVVPVAVGSGEQHKQRLLRIAAKLATPFIYADRGALERIGSYAAGVGGSQVHDALRLRALFTDEDGGENERCAEPVLVRPQDVALIQFSSGSTSEPKGVMLSHANLLANIRGVTERAGLSSSDVSLSWMPLTHDFGLIGFYLVTFANGMHVHLMPTELFVRRPYLWLQYASSVRASLLGSPNFGYRHLLKALGDRSVGDLDLSSVRLIYNGAEPISASLCEEFVARLRDAKLRPTVMYPAYGLAEACVAASLPEPDTPLLGLELDRRRMNVGMEIEPARAGTDEALTLVSEGTAVPHCDLRIAADDDSPVRDGCIGHIQIRGASVTRGYYGDSSATAAALTADGWLRTGDLGFLRHGQLYVSGRSKELLLIRGQNFYPHDLEQLAQTVPGVEPGKVVAVGVPTEDRTEEQLVIFVMHRGGLQEFAPIALEVGRAIGQRANLEVAAVVPVKQIPKTTSGKLQRVALRERYSSGEFETQLRELALLLRVGRAEGPDRRTAIEEKLKSICAVALQGKQVGVLDNLFESGASSVTLVSIHEQIDQEFPGQLDLAELYDFPTIAAMATKLHAGSL